MELARLALVAALAFACGVVMQASREKPVEAIEYVPCEEPDGD